MKALVKNFPGYVGPRCPLPRVFFDLLAVLLQAPNKMRDGFLAVSDAAAQWEDKTQVRVEWLYTGVHW